MYNEYVNMDINRYIRIDIYTKEINIYIYMYMYICIYVYVYIYMYILGVVLILFVLARNLEFPKDSAGTGSKLCVWSWSLSRTKGCESIGMYPMDCCFRSFAPLQFSRTTYDGKC